jgi:lipopolysaccharide transport system ATP-binding protein
MEKTSWEVGICGTFDVANFGDLLFPLIAELELSERLGAVNLHRFSYHAKAAPEWPFDVTSVTELPQAIHRLDALLIGGGFLIRFDKEVAPGYAPPGPQVHHPTGYWLSPALMAVQHNVPLIWNAPGTDGHPIPEWGKPLMELVMRHSSYVAVRDEASRTSLGALTATPIALVPDTAFGLPRLLHVADGPGPGFTQFCEAAGLHGPYVVIHAKPGLEGVVEFVRENQDRFRGLQFVALPVGPVLGDVAAALGDFPGVVRIEEWPHPLLLAELIARAEAVIGQSYHLCVAALAFGVPAFLLGVHPCKFSVLHRFGKVFELPADGRPDIDWFLGRIGRTVPPAAERAAGLPLRDHWDRIAAVIRSGPARTAPALNRYWQSLPGLLEAADRERHESAARELAGAESQDRLQNALAAASVETVARQERLDCVLDLLTTCRADAVQARARLDEAREQMSAARRELAERQATLDGADSQLAAARAETTEVRERLVLVQEAAKRDAAEQRARQDELTRNLTSAHAEIVARDVRISEILASRSWRITDPLRTVARLVSGRRSWRLINMNLIRLHRLNATPFRWAAMHHLFAQNDAEELAATYPMDHFKLVAAYGEHRQYEYDARSLIGMNADSISFPDQLSDAWRALALDLLSPEYRAAMTAVTGHDLTRAPMEVNLFHYGPQHSLSPHQDLPEKILTHIFYFNRCWDGANGGCLRILRSPDPADMAAEILPILGNSCVIVRSDNSWHAVSRVAERSTDTRRSMTVTFYRPGAVSTMWPPGEPSVLRDIRVRDGK